jgi:hypothetical protein
MAPTPEDILEWNIRKRPSVWAQYHTKLRGKDYRFEQLMADGSLDIRRPHEIDRSERNIGLRGQRQFLQQPLDDQHPHKTMQKSRQCGASENEVRETLWFGDQHEFTKQAYVFPTFDQVADFSKTRIEEVMRDSPYVKDRMGIDPLTNKKKKGGDDVLDNVRLRKIGSSFIFFRSGHTPKAGEGIDVDKVTFDEIDRMHPKVMIAFNETLSSSAFGWRRDVSTPSLPGVGVNASFKDSDQQHWFMKCPHCNNWFTLIHDYPKCVVELPKDSRGVPNHDLNLSYPFIQPQDTHAYICIHCKAYVSDETRIKGIWRPLYDYKTRIRGYQISQLFCPWISASDVERKRQDYNLEQLFENYVIGRPYLGDNVMLTDGDIMRCIDRSIKSPYDIRREDVAQGVDWGNTSWGINAMPHPDSPEKTIILDIWTADDSMSQLDEDSRKDNPHVRITGEKMYQWDVRRGVFDAGYGKDRNWELKQDFPSKVFSCFYPNLSTDVTKRMEDVWNEDDGTVNVDRTITLKIMAKMFRDGKIVIPDWVANNPHFGTFKKHLTNLVLIREIETDEKTNKEMIKERVGTLPGGDHFGHAMNYLTIALRKVREAGGNSSFFF